MTPHEEGSPAAPASGGDTSEDTPFGAAYAAAYDVLYREKDYAAECDVLERVLSEYGAPSPARILDLGCGTGRHAVELARRGHQVVGIDRSGEMIRRARSAAESAGVGGCVRFLEGDVAEPHGVEPCDAASMMFNVIGYLVHPEEARAALRHAGESLREHGLLVFDFWYRDAVLRHPPERRWALVEGEGERLLRLADPRSGREEGVLSITYTLLRLSDDRVLDEAVERHDVRFHSGREVEGMLESAGFELLHIGGFPDVRDPPGIDSWSATAIARVR